jgi:hypothetical protein
MMANKILTTTLRKHLVPKVHFPMHHPKLLAPFALQENTKVVLVEHRVLESAAGVNI